MNNTKHPKTIYALLIGINKYEHGNNLFGCINDILAISNFFQDFCSRSGIQWAPAFQLAPHEHELSSLNDEINEKGYLAPTRENVIEHGFPHFKQAKPGDICLLYYSGHGSFGPAPAIFWGGDGKADQYLETLVLSDSRASNGGRDLMDKELGYLIYEALRDEQRKEKEEVHFLAIMDCCHAGNITRDEEVTDRMDTINPWQLAPEEYYGFENYQIEKDGKKSVPVSHHIVLGASRSYQSAKEQYFDKQKHGVFTHALLKALQKEGGTTYSYQQLMEKVNLMVTALTNDQYPQLEAPYQEEIYATFLGGKVQLPSVEYLVYWDAETEVWLLKAGQLHGIEPPSGVSKTVLRRLDRAEDQGELITVEEVFPSVSSVKGNFSEEKQEKEVPISVRLIQQAVAGKKIAFDPDGNQEMFHNLGQLIDELNEDPETALKFIQVESTIEGADYWIRTQGSNYLLSLPGSDVPLFKRTNVPEALLAHAEHVAKWMGVLAMDNAASEIPSDDVKIRFWKVEGKRNLQKEEGEEILIDLSKGQSILPAIELNYEFDGKEWRQPGFRCEIRLTQEDQGYFVSGLILGSKFGIANKYLPPGELKIEEEGSLRFSYIKKNKRLYTIPFSVDLNYLKMGITEIKDYIKIILSTEPFDTDNLMLPALQMDDQLYRTHRDAEDDKDAEEESYDGPVYMDTDWKVITIPLVVKRPMESFKVCVEKNRKGRCLKYEHWNPKLQANIQTDFNIFKITSPITAKASVNTLAEINRQSEELGPRQKGERSTKFKASIFPPPQLWGNSSAAAQAFSTSRNATADQSVSFLELTEVDEVQRVEVNLDNPIVIEPTENLGEDEVIIPYGYDPTYDLYLPFGTTNENGIITISALPEETPGQISGTADSDSRSVGGSIKIWFKKMVTRRFTGDYDYPRLGLAFINSKECYNDQVIKKQINETTKPIALFIHGLFGDTTLSPRALQLAHQEEQALIDQYGVVLTFDYENLGTKIQDTAADLKKKLKDYDLLEGNKKIHIYAHSMGGLVARYFIEVLGGGQYVEHLIQLGVPNAGSQWADIQEWIATSTSYLINGAAVLKPYLLPLTIAGRFLGKAQETMNQLQPGSDFFEKLIIAKGEPKTIYHLIAGDTTMIKATLKENMSLWKKVTTALKARGLYAAVDLGVFEDQENDAAVLVESMKQSGHLQEENIHIVGCNHFSYFVEEASLQALAKIGFGITGKAD